MKATLYFVLCTLFLVASARAEYIVIVDAGSTGSRIHVYQHEIGDDELPEVHHAPYPLAPGQALWTMKVKPGLAEFVDQPVKLKKYLMPLLNYAKSHIQGADGQLSKAHFYLMGTGGMRKLSERDQKRILRSVKSIVKKETPFQIQKIEVIPGEAEGIYGWLSVNYLKGRLAKGEFTEGALDLGGSSAEITFQYDTAKADARQRFYIGDREYVLYTKSYQGLGQDEAFHSIGSEACYPKGYPVNEYHQGDWDKKACEREVILLLDKYSVEHATPTLPYYMQFLAFSAYYYTFDFFQIPNPVNLSHLSQVSGEFCELSWQEMKEHSPNVPTSFLHRYCFNALYIETLLGRDHGFGFESKDERLYSGNSIDEQEIEWTLGAVLFELLNRKLLLTYGISNFSRE